MSGFVSSWRQDVRCGACTDSRDFDEHPAIALVAIVTTILILLAVSSRS
jgi:hypothetical protein